VRQLWAFDCRGEREGLVDGALQELWTQLLHRSEYYNCLEPTDLCCRQVASRVPFQAGCAQLLVTAS